MASSQHSSLDLEAITAEAHSVGIAYDKFPWPDDETTKVAEAALRMASHVLDLVEQLETLRGTLEQIAGPTPTSHRKTVDQLTDAVKWRQGMARDALARIGSNPAKRPT